MPEADGRHGPCAPPLAALEEAWRLDDELALAAVEALAREKAENMRLRRERDRLKSRIAAEDGRLSLA